MKDKDYQQDLDKHFPDAPVGTEVLVSGWATGNHLWTKTEGGWKREVRTSPDG